MSNERTDDADETEAKPTITIAERNSGRDERSKETITIAEKPNVEKP
ncbi:MAG: hypothetical protein H7070_15530 [Saprospiraceae bacterium]|nr:hypothetical protein [Pyrinomonadaceae bacterium]